jgi:hypothetical protein
MAVNAEGLLVVSVHVFVCVCASLCRMNEKYEADMSQYDP